MVKSKKNNLHLEVSKSSKTSGSNMISSKRGAKKASSAIKKGAVSSKYGKRRVLQKIKLKIMPSLDDIKEFFGVKDKAQKKSSSAAAPAKKLMPSSSTNDTKKVSSDVKENPQGSGSLQSRSTDSESSGSKTVSSICRSNRRRTARQHRPSLWRTKRRKPHNTRR